MSEIVYSASMDTGQLDAAVQRSRQTIGQWINEMTRGGQRIDQSINKNADTLKNSVQQQRALIKNIEDDLKRLQKAWEDASPGKTKKAAYDEVRAAQKALAEENANLINLQKQEEEAADSLTGKISKLALSLGGATAGLQILKKAFGETTQGMNLFNQVGAVTKQVLYDIVSGQGLSMTRIQSAVDIQRQLNNLRQKEYVENYKAAQEENKFQQLWNDTLDADLTRMEKIRIIDEALAAHNRAVDIREEQVRARLKLKERELLDKPSSEKIKKEYSALYVELEQLDASRVSSTKRLTRQRSTLIKEETEEELKWRKDLHDGLTKLVDDYLETEKENAEKLRDLRNEIEVNKLTGKEKELKELEQKYKIDMEMYAGNEAMKAVLTERYAQQRYQVEMEYLDKIKAENTKFAEVFQKIDPGASNIYTAINRSLTGAGKTPAAFGGLNVLRKTNQTKKGIAEQRDKNIKADLEDELRLRQEIVRSASRLVYEMGQAAGLSEEQLSVLNVTLAAFEDMVSGNWPAAVVSMLSGIIANMGQAADKFQERIDDLNKQLEEQQRLVDLSSRKGNEEEEIRKKLKILQEQKKVAEEAVRIAEINLKDAQQAFLGIGWGVDKRKEQLDKAQQQLQDYQNQIADTEQALTDLLGGNVTENTLAGAIAQGFREGKTSVDDFAGYMNDILTDAVMDIFNKELLSKGLTPLQEYISQTLSDKVLTPEERQNINQQITEIANANKQLWKDLTSTLNIGGETPGLSGAIQRSITEETGSELAGLMRVQRDDTRTIRDYTKFGVVHLANIEANTYNTVVELKNAVAELKSINTNTKPVYAGEM